MRKYEACVARGRGRGCGASPCFGCYLSALMKKIRQLDASLRIPQFV